MKLVAIGFKNYPEYLHSPHWAKVKAAYRASDHSQDCICGEAERVQLHHMTYERVGDERLSDLTPLCPTCHAMIHALEARGDIGLDFAGLVDARRAVPHQAKVAKARADAEMDTLHGLAGFEDIHWRIIQIKDMPQAKRLLGGQLFGLIGASKVLNKKLNTLYKKRKLHGGNPYAAS